MHKFIDNIVAFSLKNKFFIFFCTTIAVIAGIVSFKHTPIDAFPDVTNTKVTIITQWPGRSAEEVEKFITIPIEIAMNPVQKKTDIRSTTLFGLSVINVMFEDQVDDFTARQQVYNLLNDADLPEGITPEVQPLYGPTGEIFRYTLRSDKRSVRELKTIQDWVIERNLRAVSGVADIVSFGGEVKTFEVSVNPHQLINYGITALELYNAIANSNINVGGDVITKSSQAYVVRGIGLINDLEELRNIVVKNINGTPVLVRHLADVHESCLPRLGQVGRMDEDDVVQGIVVMRKGENPGEVIDALKTKIEDINKNILPQDVEIVPFYDRENLVNLAVRTVTHNLIEGILLVTFIVLIFMADWRTTVVVAVVIPLALLFAFICLRAMGMSANLLSMGAIDFGIIIDGAVVMVEGVFVALDKKAREVGMPAFNRMSKMGLIRHTAKDKAKAVFFSKLIIITALIPIFSFQKVEGKMFSPLAYTLGFALLGALLFTLTLVPVMSSMLLKKNVREKNNFFVRFINEKASALFDKCYAHRKLSIGLASIAAIVGLWMFTLLGTEFLPQLNEGSIYIRATLPQSISLDESVQLANQMRRKLAAYPEVRQVLSQTGRPNDGTDATGFYNIEFHVDIYPEKDWESKLSKLQLIDKMQDDLSLYPGIDFNFSQPITDNVEEAASGVKGSIAVKVFGKDLYKSEKIAVQIDKILSTVQGIEDLGVIRNIGQPELRIELNEQSLARYGVAKEDVQSIIEMAIGGKSASLLYEDERKFNIMVRYKPEYRQNEEEIGKILVPTMNGTMIPIKELAEIKTITGPLLIFRDNHTRFCAREILRTRAGHGYCRGRSPKEGQCFRTPARRIHAKVDGRLREPATRHQTPFASRSGKYRYHLYHPVRTVLQCTGCKAGVTECTLCSRRRYYCAAHHPLQLLHIGRYRVHRPVRYLYSERCDYDFGHQAQHTGTAAIAGSHKDKHAFAHPPRSDDGSHGSHRPDAGSHESRHRFGIATPVGNRHYRRIDRRYFLCPVHLPADCGDGLQEDAV